MNEGSVSVLEGSEIDAVVRDVGSLCALFIARPDGRLIGHWQRLTASWNLDALGLLYARLSKVNRDGVVVLGSDPTQTAQILIEIKGSYLMLRAYGDGLLLGMLFESRSPLGMVRLHTQHLSKALLELIGDRRESMLAEPNHRGTQATSVGASTGQQNVPADAPQIEPSRTKVDVADGHSEAHGSETERSAEAAPEPETTAAGPEQADTDPLAPDAAPAHHAGANRDEIDSDPSEDPQNHESSSSEGPALPLDDKTGEFSAGTSLDAGPEPDSPVERDALKEFSDTSAQTPSEARSDDARTPDALRGATSFWSVIKTSKTQDQSEDAIEQTAGEIDDRQAVDRLDHSELELPTSVTELPPVIDVLSTARTAESELDDSAELEAEVAEALEVVTRFVPSDAAPEPRIEKHVLDTSSQSQPADNRDASDRPSVAELTPTAPAATASAADQQAHSPAAETPLPSPETADRADEVTLTGEEIDTIPPSSGVQARPIITASTRPTAAPSPADAEQLRDQIDAIEAALEEGFDVPLDFGHEKVPTAAALIDDDGAERPTRVAMVEPSTGVELSGQRTLGASLRRIALRGHKTTPPSSSRTGFERTGGRPLIAPARPKALGSSPIATQTPVPDDDESTSVTAMSSLNTDGRGHGARTKTPPGLGTPHPTGGPVPAETLTERANKALEKLKTSVPDPRASLMRVAFQTGLALGSLRDPQNLTREQVDAVERAVNDIIGLTNLG